MKRTLALLVFAAVSLPGAAFAQSELLKQVRDSSRSAAQLNAQREQRFAKARDEEIGRAHV